jgi:integrase
MTEKTIDNVTSITKFKASKDTKPREIWENSSPMRMTSLGVPIPDPETFVTAAEAKAIPAPTDKGHVEVWSKHDRWFGVRVSKATAAGKVHRVWIARFKDGSKHTKRNIGRVFAMDIDEARNRAYLLRRIGANRTDDEVPVQVKGIYETYCMLKGGEWSQATKDDYEKAFKMVPDWHNRRIDGFKAVEITKRYLKIAEEIEKKHKNKKAGWNGRSTAISVMRLMRVLFNYAKNHNMITFNPCDGLKSTGQMKPPARKAKPMEFAKLREFWRYIHEKCPPSTAHYILIGLFTGMRLSVLNDLNWDNYSHRDKTYKLLPDMRGNKTRQTINMPLPALLVKSVFEPRFKNKKDGERWILPSVRYADEPVRSIKGTLKAMSKELDIHIGVHDLRRLSATIAYRATRGDTLMVKRLLTHNLQKPEEREAAFSGYVSTEADQLRETMNLMVDYVYKAVGEANPYAEA